jgi:hypothetical protein
LAGLVAMGKFEQIKYTLVYQRGRKAYIQKYKLTRKTADVSDGKPNIAIST